MHTPVKTWLGLTIIAIVALVAGFFVWFQQKNLAVNDQPIINFPVPKQKACTEEAKQCPDGSYVSRTGPKCEFATCPEAIDIKDKIIINSPVKDAIITSPISISGRARGTWFFEGSFPMQVYDSNNKLLGISTAKFSPKSESDTWMTENFVDFCGEIKFSQPATDSGYILFKKDNPSGLPQNDESFKLPIKFLIIVPDNKDLSQAEKCHARIISYMNNIKGEGMANPASMFCSCMGGQAGTDTHADGGQTATCKVDGKTRDAWEYFNKMNPNSNL